MLGRWLTPFEPELPNKLWVALGEKRKISVIRIWNYNKSRIHAFRGARNVEVYVHGTLVYEGEIQRAPGMLTGADSFATLVCLTKDAELVSSIANRHWLSLDAETDNMFAEIASDRPATAGSPGGNEQPLGTMDWREAFADARNQMADRPGTAVARKNNSEPTKNIAPIQQPEQVAPAQPPREAASSAHGTELCFEVIQTWGDPHYVGLSGLEVYGQDGAKIDMSMCSIDAKPLRDVNALDGGVGGDHRTLDKLTDGVTQTCDDVHMWLAPLQPGNAHTLTIKLRKPTTLRGFRIWNYNKCLDDTYRGIGSMRVLLDGQDLLGQPITIRKAPGHTHFDYGQTVIFSAAQRPHFPTPMSRCAIDQHYVTARLPRVLTVRIDLVSTWGDLHYIGLNGIMFHDQDGIPVPADQVTLYSQAPGSVRETPGHQHDVRTLDKLLDGTNDAWDDGHMWLAPFTTGKPHTLWACLKQEVAISTVQFWNYSK